MCSKNDSARMAMEKNKSLSKKERCDAQFAVAATDVNMLEAKLATLAQSKSQNEEVKKLSATLASSHAKSEEELKMIAAKNNIAVPETLSERSQKYYDHFAKKEGKKFDKAYAKCTAKAHKKQICKYKKEAKKGNIAQVKEFAASKVSMLEQHKDLANQTCKSLK
jgi:putative membrane protein